MQPELEGRFEKDRVADEVGRLRLKAGDTVGVAIDTGSHNGDGTVTFFVNGVQVCIVALMQARGCLVLNLLLLSCFSILSSLLQVHETVHIFSEVGEDWIPYVALGSDKIKVVLYSVCCYMA